MRRWGRGSKTPIQNHLGSYDLQQIQKSCQCIGVPKKEGCCSQMREKTTKKSKTNHGSIVHGEFPLNPFPKQKKTHIFPAFWNLNFCWFETLKFRRRHLYHSAGSIEVGVDGWRGVGVVHPLDQLRSSQVIPKTHPEFGRRIF